MEYIENIVVGAIDILGIGSILESNKGTQRAMKILTNIWVNASDPHVYMTPDLNTERKRVFWGSLKFGDSIYIFGNREDTIKEQTNWLISRIMVLMVFGLYKFNVFLRCGIAKGDLMINTIDIINPPQHLKEYSENIFIGSSMSRAHILEENQKWMGCAILGDLESDKYSRYLVEYDIPLKNKEIFKEPYTPKYAINWIKLAKENEGKFGIDTSKTKQLIDSIAIKIGNVDNKNIQEKIHNTKIFVDRCIGE